MCSLNADPSEGTLDRARAASDGAEQEQTPGTIVLNIGGEEREYTTEQLLDELEKAAEQVAEQLERGAAIAEAIEEDPDLAWPPQYGREFRFSGADLKEAADALNPMINPAEALSIRPTELVEFADIVADNVVASGLGDTDYGSWMLAIGYSLAGGKLVPTEEQEKGWTQGYDNAAKAHPDLFEDVQSTPEPAPGPSLTATGDAPEAA